MHDKIIIESDGGIIKFDWQNLKNTPEAKPSADNYITNLFIKKPVR